MNDRRYDLDSYLEAFVCTLRYEAADETLRSWHERRRDTLAKALHVPKVNDPPLNWLLSHALGLAKQVDHPFSGVIEFPAKTTDPFMDELVQLGTAFSAAHTASFALARSILISCDAELKTRTVTEHELRQLGFDPNSEPDEIEFL